MRTTNKLQVIFKKIEDEIIAIFPFEIWNRYEVASYMHVGQHGGCDWLLPYELRTATPKEYADLLSELKSIYDDCRIEVLKRLPNKAEYAKLFNK